METVNPPLCGNVRVGPVGTRGAMMLSKRLLGMTLALGAALLSGFSWRAQAADLQKFNGVRLVDNPGNDGDSFLVQAADQSFRVRLYYVDCPETAAVTPADARRLREQMRYFGLSVPTRVIFYGVAAKKIVAQILAEPFTVYTSFASALGRSKEGRVYAFITTAKGEDLAGLLVKHGLARAFGVGRETPDGISRDEFFAQLRDQEAAAMLKRIGVWADSDPERIAELRADQRREDAELQRVQEDIKPTSSPDAMPPPTARIDPNTASQSELESLPGIGPVLAERIIAGRPYRKAEDLLRVSGIFPKSLERLRPHLKFEKGGEE